VGSPQASGTVLVLLSAVAFGTLAIIAKLGYRAGLVPAQLLSLRFLLAAAGMLIVSLAVGQNPFRLPPRKILALLAMGAIGYFGQSTTFFFALRSLPASVTELVLYTYPAMVVAAGWLVFHQRVPRLQLAALVGSFAGVVLLVGGISLAFGWALLMAIASPLLFTAYILVGARVMAGVPGVAAGTLSILGTAVSWTLVALFTGTLKAPAGGAQWAAVVAIAVIPTMFAISAFLAAMPRIGAARTALLSTVEPVVTVVLAFALLGDRFVPTQVLGALLVLGSVVLLQLPQSPRSPESPPAA
jgi:drug/metabolite transporter (DMT)-like permease